MRRLLAAMSFPFLILAGLLAWDAYSALTGRGRPLPEWRIYLQFIAAAVAVVLAMLGVRERHRGDR